MRCSFCVRARRSTSSSAWARPSAFSIGFVVVVYQILYTEVTNHLPQFATMKAMGFTDGYLLKVVLSQAFILSILGYIPGFFLALVLYRVATVRHSDAIRDDLAASDDGFSVHVNHVRPVGAHRHS